MNRKAPAPESAASPLTAGTHLRYVVLHHTGIEPEHFDLLLDSGGDALLPTWRLNAKPGASAVRAQRQPDHRRIYMTYEGEISGGRGRVKRVEAGEAVVLACDGVTCRVALGAECTVELPL